MSKRKEPDAAPTGLSRAAGKRKVGDEETFDNVELEDLFNMSSEDLGYEGLARGVGMEAEEDGIEADTVGLSASEIAFLPQADRADSEIHLDTDTEDDDVDISEEELRTAERLDFSNLELTAGKARWVARMIAENDSLAVIQFDGHELPIGELTEEDELEWDSEEYTDVEAIIIATLLEKDSCTVKRLDLARNQITDHGAKALAKMLQTNSTLEYLNLESNMISEKGVHASHRLRCK